MNNKQIAQEIVDSPWEEGTNSLLGRIELALDAKDRAHKEITDRDAELVVLADDDRRLANMRRIEAEKQIAEAKRRLANIAHSLREHLTDPGLFSER